MRSILLLLVLVLVLATPVSARLASPRSAPSAPPKNAALVVYYFYHFPRCTSCVTLESHAEAAIKEHFASELASGKIQWKSVNVGEDENAHFEEDYRLESSSVVLVHVVKGKRGAWKRLDKVWDIGFKDKAGVSAYIVGEVKSALKRWKLHR